MKNVVKYICAVVLLFGLSVNVWGGEPPSGYTKVTNISSLSTGDYVILYYPTESYGISGTASCPSYDSGTEATLSTSEGRWVQYYVTKSTTTFTLKDVSANKYVYDDSKSFRYSGTATNFSVTASGCLQSSSSGNNLLLSTVFSGRDCQRSSARFNTSGTTFYVYKVGADKNKASNNYYTVSPTSTISITVDGADGFRSGNPENAWLLDVNVGSSLTSNINAEFTDFPSSVSDFIYPLNYAGTSNGYITNRVSGDDYVGLVYYGYSFIPNGTYSGNIHVYTTGTDTDIEYYVPLNITVINSVACTEYDISYDREGEGDKPTGDDSKCEDETVSFTPAPDPGYKYNGATVYLSDWENVHTTLNANTTSFTMPNEDVYVVAYYVPQSYTIALYNQGADTGHEGTESISVTYGASTNLTGTAITLPIKTGYTFGGYYTETNGGGVQIIAADGSVNAEVMDDEEIYTGETKQWFYANDITLYAKWTPNSHTLTISSVDNVTISATTPSVAEGSNAAVNYGTTVTLSKTSLTSGYYWGGWKAYKTGDTNTPVAVSNNQFTMPDYDVTVSAIIYPKAKLLTRCQNTVTYHYAGGTTSERVATDAHPTGYTPTDCENKRFMGWTTSDVGSALTQVAPSMTDPTTVAVNRDSDYYAVYASKNGFGELDSISVPEENFNAYTSVSGYQNENPRVYGIWSVIGGGPSSIKEVTDAMGSQSIVLQRKDNKNAELVSTKITHLKGIRYKVAQKGGVSYRVLYSADGSAWTEWKANSQPNTTGAYVTLSLSSKGDYYIKFEVAYNSTLNGPSYRVYVDDIRIYREPSEWWYSDYSNGCEMAETATITFTNGGSISSKSASSIPETYIIEAPVKDGYTFDHYVIKENNYFVGEQYVIAHDMTATTIWKENPTISGDVYVTAGYTNSTAQPVQSSMTVTATTTENKTGTLTIANATGNEGGTFEAIITNGTVDNAPLNATIAIKYTPTQAGVEETATMTATIDGASTNFTVHGRSLPAEFVIAAKQGNNWYALPADMVNSGTYAGTMITVDDNTNPTKAVLTRTGTKYALYQGSGAVTHVRFASVAAEESNRKALWANNAKDDTGIQNWAAVSGAAADNYKWELSTTDNTSYVLHSLAGNERDLRLSSGNNWGMYTAGVNSLRFLPIETEIDEATGLSVEEWYPTKVRIKTTDAIASAQVALNDEDLTDATCTAKGTNYYEVETPTLTTAAAATGTLTLKYTTTGSATYAKVFAVPVIISSETTSVTTDDVLTGLGQTAYNNSDLYVRDGAVLTIDGATYIANTFKNVWIMPSGKIIVPDTKRLTASSLNLFGGIDEIYNGSTYTIEKYGVPEFSLKGSLYRNSDPLTSATYYMRTDVEQMYSFGAPCQINFSDIKYVDGTAVVPTTDFYAEAYNGARRAEGRIGGNWLYEDAFANKRFDRGGGYLIAAETQNGETYAVLKMPMTIDETDNAVSVTAYGAGTGVADVHKGWNFISNPFMVTTAPTTLTVHPETGSDKKFDYVTIPDEANYRQSFYDQYCVMEGVLKPFKSFFVQVDVTGTITFDDAARQAPSRRMEGAEEESRPEVFYTVALKGGSSKEGSFGIRLCDDYTEEYEIGKDLEYMTPAGHAAYTYYNGYRLKYAAMSTIGAQIAIPIGYTAREAGTYTWTLKAYTNGQDLEHVYLIDYELDVTHDLLTGPYEFTTAVQTENQTRFAIATEVGEHRAPTDVETVEEDSGGGGPIKFIYHDKMYILNDNVIYDATGKRVKVVANGQKGGAL